MTPQSCRVARGSSPHTRGALSDGRISSKSTRIIPAYAGSTTYPALAAFVTADHPRIRGEHLWIFAILGSYVGSSPHTRGAPRYDTREKCRSGIIPAYAGSTLLPST